MKALTKSLKFMGAVAVFLALAACGKNDSNNNNNVAAVQYGYQNGQCYDITHNTPVAYNYCTQVGTNGQFQYINGQCVSTVNGNQVVDPTYCQQSQYNQGYNTGYGYGGCNPAGGYAYGYGAGYGYYYGANYTAQSCGGGTYGGSMSCSGRQMYRYDGYTASAQLVYCDAYSCRGQFLYDINTRVRVYCQ